MISTIVIKYLLPVLGGLALLFGVFEFGSSHGYSNGYTIAWNTQQTAINKMVTAQNLETDANNNKLQDFESAAQAARADAASATFAAMTTRADVVTRYLKANPQAAKTCGWSLPTVEAINNILGAGSPPPASVPIGASQ
jgi:hypothetical protein